MMPSGPPVTTSSCGESQSSLPPGSSSCAIEDQKTGWRNPPAASLGDLNTKSAPSRLALSRGVVIPPVAAAAPAAATAAAPYDAWNAPEEDAAPPAPPALADTLASRAGCSVAPMMRRIIAFATCWSISVDPHTCASQTPTLPIQY